MKMSISEIRKLIREELVHSLDEFVAKEMPSGTSWKTKGGNWAAKNANGVINHWYGQDEESNRKAADDFRRDSSRRMEK
jgi:hypothetical protein